jgi:tetratricopeptide (TPR) repeat protein
MSRILRELSGWAVAGALLAGAASGARAQTRPATAEKEVEAIGAALEEALSDFASPREIMPGGLDFESNLRRVSAVAARVDLFELRFGTPPARVKGWEAVAAAARKRLDITKEQEDGARRYFAGDSLWVTLGILMELGGAPDEAVRHLRQVRPGGTSGNWSATLWLIVHTRESAILQARGSYADALGAHQKALASVRLALHSKNLPELYFRHGFLLAKNGREPEALVQYQRVVDLFPGTPASDLATRRLKDAGKLVPPSAASLKARLQGDDRLEAIQALAAHRFSESFAMLAEALASSKGWDYGASLDALVALGDRRAIPVLSGEIARADVNSVGDLLVALWKLGDKSQVVAGLTRMKGAFFVRADTLHPVLKQIYGGGPDLGPEEEHIGTAFAKAWLGFIESKGPASRPDSRR